MSVTLVVAIIVIGVAWVLVKKCASEMVSEELRARVNDLPAVFLEFALRRLPAGMQDYYRPEWEDDLAAFAAEHDRYPVTRFFQSFAFAARLLVGVRSIRKETKAIARQAKRDESLERTPTKLEIEQAALDVVKLHLENRTFEDHAFELVAELRGNKRLVAEQWMRKSDAKVFISFVDQTIDRFTGRRGSDDR